MSNNAAWIQWLTDALDDKKMSCPFKDEESITICKRIEELIKQHHNNKRALDASIAGIVSIDSDGAITFLNTEFAKMLSVDQADTLGQLMTKFVDENEWHKLIDTLRTSQQTIEGELTLQSRADTEVIVWFKCLLNKPCGKDYCGCTLVCRDITKQKESEQALLEKTHELEVMNASMVGRELKMVELKNEIEELKEQSQ